MIHLECQEHLGHPICTEPLNKASDLQMTQDISLATCIWCLELVGIHPN